MPIGSLLRTDSTLSFTLQSLSGDLSKVSFPRLTTLPTDTAINNLRNAVAATTNAALIAQAFTGNGVYNVPSVPDEAYSAAQVKLVLVFQDDVQGETRRVEIPAPDATLFGDDGATVDRSNPSVVALIDSIRAVIGTGFTLKRGFLASRTRRPRVATLSLASTSYEPDTPAVDAGPGVPD